MTTGLTFRALEEEALRFLTARGANQLYLEFAYQHGARNRPALMYENGEAITIDEAKRQGFKSKD